MSNLLCRGPEIFLIVVPSAPGRYLNGNFFRNDFAHIILFERSTPEIFSVSGGISEKKFSRKIRFSGSKIRFFEFLYDFLQFLENLLYSFLLLNEKNNFGKNFF